jgi:CRISPR/Cas system CSM-associated protein Csm3 (group 7 of RAMP superfamily)
MARTLKTRITVRGHLRTQSPLHVGGLGGNAETDLALAKDGRDRYYIPGTSLAGACRNWMENHCGKSLTDRLWGYQQDDKGHASFLTLADIALETQPTIEIRDGVGIDREWGSAAESIKYDRAIIPTGTSFPIQMTLEIPASDVDYQPALQALLDALCHGKIRLGAAKSRGLGRVQLLNCQILEQTLDTPDGILSVLKNITEPSAAPWKNYSPSTPQTLPQFIITIDWQPVDALMVKSSQEGLAVDMLPLTSGIDQEMALVLPGSSIKGVVRSQAERILRTVCPLDRPLPDSPYERFLNQIDMPLATTLFGSAARKNQPLSHAGLSAVFVEDCYSQQHMTPEQWNAVLKAEDSATLLAALKAAHLPDTQQAFHVAIDRWTGGAAEDMLYTTLEPFKIPWNPIEMELQIARIPHPEQIPAIALLLLALRDFALGRLPLGYGGNRGLGAVQVNTITLTATNLEGTALAQYEETRITLDSNGAIEATDPNLIPQIEADWQNWIIAKNTQNLPAAGISA